MKIAFIVNRFPALSETFILNQVTGLLDRGHQVDIFSYNWPTHSTIHHNVIRYNLLQHTHYIKSYVSMPGSKLHRLLRACGYITQNFCKNPNAVLNALNIIKYGRESISLKMLYQITPFVQNGSYDIVHCHYGYLAKLGVNLKLARAIRGPLITTFRGHDISKYVREYGENVYDKIFYNGDLFLCVSNEIRSILIKLGCNPKKILVHRSGVDLSIPRFHTREFRQSNKLKVLTVARLVEKKGIEYGIRAITKLSQNNFDIEYRIAGDGPLKDHLYELIEKLNVRHNVILLGWQCQEQIASLLQEADILLAPSVTSQSGDQEGIPGVIMEAMAWGVPVISTRHSGIPEVVQDGKTGILVPERDVNAIVEQCKYVIEHPEQAAEMSRNARQFVEEHYDLDKLNDRLVQTYQDLLTNADRAHRHV